MPVSIAPSTEACQALADRINSGTAYSLDRLTAYHREITTPLDELDGLEIDVMATDETQLIQTLDTEDRTSHKITIWVREKLRDKQQETIDARMLLVRQIFQRVNNWDSADRRVRVWEVDKATQMTPDKNLLRTMSVFAAKIVLRVEVEASP